MTAYHNIPKELKDRDQWVVWGPGGNRDKQPINPKGGYAASSTDPKTWGTFEDAISVVERYSGIGFVFSADDPYFGIDLDTMDEDQKQTAFLFETYAEYSPSGKGMHIIGKGKLPGKGMRKGDQDVAHKGWEIYDKARYFTFTGNVINNVPIKECQAILDEFILDIFGAPYEAPIRVTASYAPCDESDIELLDIMERSTNGHAIMRLWHGDTSDFNLDDSRADASLMERLFYFTRGDRTRAETMFRQSGLNRPKFENRQDYRDATWALASRDGTVRPETEVYASPDIAMGILNEWRRKQEEAKASKPKRSNTHPWRSVTTDHVAEAIAGTILQPMVDAFRSPAKIPLPFETGLLKALVLAGLSLSSKATARTEGDPELAPPRDIHDITGMSAPPKPIDMARTRIMTCGGQALNVYAMLVGESGDGKDVGNLLSNVAARMRLDIGTLGTEEGAYDAYMETDKGNGLTYIDEFGPYFNPKDNKYKVQTFLTAHFSKGRFNVKLSQRGQNSQPRMCEYCFPNVFVCVQPEYLEAMDTSIAQASGFMGRFLMAKIPPSMGIEPTNRPTTEAEERLYACVKQLQSVSGIALVDDGTDGFSYSRPLRKMFFDGHAPFKPTWKRLSNEYYARFALMLSKSSSSNTKAAIITPDGWTRAEVLVKYFFAQTETIMGQCYDDRETMFIERLCSKFLNALKKKGPLDETQLSKSVSQNGAAKGTMKAKRTLAIQELMSRGEVVRVPTQKGEQPVYAINPKAVELVEFD